MASEVPGKRQTTPQAAANRYGSAPAAIVSAACTSAGCNVTVADRRSLPPSNSLSGFSIPSVKPQAPSAFSQFSNPASINTGHSSGQDPVTAPMPAVKSEPDAFASFPQALPLASAVGTTAREPTVKMQATSAEGGSANVGSTVIPPQKREQVTFDHVRLVTDSRDLKKLEAGVSIVMKILEEFRKPVEDTKQVELVGLIDKLTARPQRARTVVAIAGGTGVGKTSLMNALLKEEKLLPTNGMRACTATVCQVLYNDVDDPNQAYRAEVEFISQDEWKADIEALFDDVVDNQKLSAAYRDPDTDAGVAFKKLEAVFPELSTDTLVKSNPKRLANKAAVQKVLGTVENATYRTARELYLFLLKYLDSSEKDTRTGIKKNANDMSYWPLVKVIRVYCKADCLSTGVCLVDLPGTMDSNAARSAVARRYMSQCNAFWLASNITRAVDDKAAKDLLGRSSRSQLKMDGIYSNITFIATWADSIDINETIESYDDDGQLKARKAREEELDSLIKGKEEELRNVHKRVQTLDTQYNTSNEELQAWEKLQRQHITGQTVYEPVAPTIAPPAKRRRRARRQLPDDDVSAENTSTRKPLTGYEISTKVAELKLKVDAEGGECDDTEQQHDDLMANVNQMKDESIRLALEIKAMCMERRNQICRDVIRVDFAAGIREIDEEAEQQDDQTFDPSVQRRNYDEVASSLSVFCTSSKMYQQLRKSGKQKLDAQAAAFETLADTQIPQLQEHAKELSKTGQLFTYKSILNEFMQLLGTLQIFAGKDDIGLPSVHLSDRDRTYEIKQLESCISNLKTILTKKIFEVKLDLLTNLRQGPNKTSSGATVYAMKQVEDIVIAFGLAANASSGRRKGLGLAYQTYRAIVKRQGNKTANPKARDFNEEILEPYLTRISTSWEETFSNVVPAALDKYSADVSEALQSFHADMASRPELAKSRSIAFRILEQQIPNHVETIRDAIEIAKNSIHGEQRIASRLFLPEIKKEMSQAYLDCMKQTGGGSWARMKGILILHVRTKKKTIYSKSFSRVKNNIEKAFQAMANELRGRVREVCDIMGMNYMAVLSRGEMIEASAVAREHTREMLLKVDKQFEAIANSAVANVEPVLELPSAVEPAGSADAA